VFIKGKLVAKVDFADHIVKLADVAIHDTVDKTSKEWLSESPKSSIRSVFEKTGDQTIGQILVKKSWESNIKSQGNQWAIHIPSRQPTSSVNKVRNQLPSWGRTPSPKASTSWSSPSIKGYNKTSDIRNAHFEASRLVAKSAPYIQDTFSQVFGANSQHTLGHNRRL